VGDNQTRWGKQGRDQVDFMAILVTDPRLEEQLIDG